MLHIDILYAQMQKRGTDPVHIFSNFEQFCNAVACLRHSPVSYTHLDVYKRQLYGSETQTIKKKEERCLESLEMWPEKRSR